MVALDIEAVIFDMDGTLVDSEVYTERAIAAALGERQLSQGDVDLEMFHGVTWQQSEERLVEIYPELSGTGLAVELQHRFHQLLLDLPPPLIPGAAEAVRAASALPCAVATSSNRESVEHVLEALGLRSCFRLTVCAEDCTRSKPEPQCYLLAAERLGFAPGRCLVFEDSPAGLRAARAAGVGTVVAITRGKKGEPLQSARELADLCIDDYNELGAGFFQAPGRFGAR